MEGVLKLHNLNLFDKSLKLGWRKRYRTSNGKWKVFLDIEDFREIYNYGQDFIERMLKIIQIPFWKDVLTSLKLLLKSKVCNDLSLICSTPLWYNNILKLPIKPTWLRKGTTAVTFWTIIAKYFHWKNSKINIIYHPIS